MRTFEDIFLMITLWGYDLMNLALWGDLGVLKVAPSIIVTYYSIQDTPLSIDQDVELDLHRFAPVSRNFWKDSPREDFMRCALWANAPSNHRPMTMSYVG